MPDRFALATFLIAVALVAPRPRAQTLGDDTRRDDVGPHLQAIEDRLSAIEDDKAWRALFESEHADIVRMQAWFALAQKTVHGAGQLCADGEELGADTADAFHDALHEYLMNLEELQPNEIFGTTKTPDARAKKKLIGAIRDIDADASEITGFEDVSVVVLTPQGSATAAVAWARRQLNTAYRLLNNRTLTYVTTPGTTAARDLRNALDAVGVALDGLLDEDGHVAPQEGKDGRPLADPLAPFKAAMDEARFQAESYRKTYLPNVRRDAHRRRAESIEQVLAAAGFQKKFLAVKALGQDATKVARGK